MGLRSSFENVSDVLCSTLNGMSNRARPGVLRAAKEVAQSMPNTALERFRMAEREARRADKETRQAKRRAETVGDG